MATVENERNARAVQVGNNISARRKAFDLSQGQLARRLGISSRNHLSAWENGHYEPSLKNLLRLALELDCAWNDFYTGDFPDDTVDDDEAA